MNLSSLISSQSFKTSKFWLLAIAAGLVALNMTLLWKADDVAHFGMSALFWLGIYSLISDKRHELKLESSPLASLLGGLIIVGVLAMSSFPLQKENPLLSIIPFISGIGLALVASGFQAFKEFRPELIILFFLSIPRVILQVFIDISPITAKFSAFLLYYVGLPVQLNDVFIYLPKGSIKVYYGCSGMESITYVLGLAILCLIMFPTNKPNHKYWVPLVGIIIGFVVNAFRVALMAVLVGYGHPEAFDYWHEGDGSLIFGGIAVLIFGGLYWFLLKNSDSETTEITNS